MSLQTLQTIRGVTKVRIGKIVGSFKLSGRNIEFGMIGNTIKVRFRRVAEL